MALTITHRFVSAKADGADTTLVNPSNWNASHAISGLALPFVISTDCNFTHVAPAENLSPSLKVATFPTVPDGINGTNTNHYIGIYNNAGTLQEVVLINGGSAVSGGSNQTITFASISGTYAAGAYKLGSVTAGIQEAIWFAGSIGTVWVPSGSQAVWYTITVPTAFTNFCLCGAGAQQSIIVMQVTNTDILHWDCAVANNPVKLFNIGFQGQPNGSSGWLVKITNTIFGDISKIYLRSGYNGIYFLNANSLQVSDILGYDINNIGMQLDAVNGGSISNFRNLNISTSGHLNLTNNDTAGLLITTGVGGTIAGPTFTDCQFLGFAAAVLGQPHAGTNMNEVTFLGGGITGHIFGIKVQATGATAFNWRLSGMQYIAAISRDVSVNGPAISIDDGVEQFHVNNSLIETGAPNFEAIDILGSKFVEITDNLIMADGTGSEIFIKKSNGVTASYIRIQDNDIGYTGTGSTTGGHAVETSADAHSNILIKGNRVYGSVAAFNFAATGLNNKFTNNDIDSTCPSDGKPTAAAAVRGSDWKTYGASGVDDTLEYCMKDKDDTYSWIQVIPAIRA